MHQYGAADNGVIINDNFTCHLGGIAYDATAAYDGIMCYVYPFHQQVVTAHYGFAFSRCTTIDGYILANGVVITYFGSRFFTAEFQILGNSAYNSSRKNGVAVPYA